MEIGSEFWTIPVSNERQINLFPIHTEFFLSGRTALDAVITDIQNTNSINSISLPSYCCETMIEPFIRHGISVSFYPVILNEKGYLTQEYVDINNKDAVLILDYFGYSGNMLPKDYKGLVIRDTTHSLFRETDYCDSNYTFGSLRKWAGFLTGGYAWKSQGKLEVELTETNLDYINLRRDAMQQKKAYILGEDSNKDYLQVFSKAENLLKDNYLGRMCKQDLTSVNYLNIDFIRSRRRENASLLFKELQDLIIFPELQKDDCPLFVPIRLKTKKRDALKQYLISKQIYCPNHWPISPLHRLNNQTIRVFSEELSLICDQRYSFAEMKRIVSEIKTFLNLENK